MKLIIATMVGLAIVGAGRPISTPAADRGTSHTGPPHFRMFDLGPAGTDSGEIGLINDDGGFAGGFETYDRSSDSHHAVAFVSVRGKPIVVTVPGFENTVATAINDRSEALIQAWNGSDNATPYPSYTDYRSFLWTGMQLLPIWVLHRTKYVQATAINDDGVIVGYIGGDTTDRYGEEDYTAFVDYHGVTRALPTLGGPHAQALALNDRGEIVGQADLPMPKFETHACLWRNGKAIDLGTLGGANSSALAINNRGQVVGWSDTQFASPQVTNPRSRAFLWEHGHMIALPGFGGVESAATEINSSGVILGGASAPGNPNGQMVIWWHRRVYRVKDLIVDPGGVRLIEPTYLGPGGEILASGYDPAGQGSTHTYLLVPLSHPMQFAERLAKLKLPSGTVKAGK